jgi:hypothetical protein
MRYADCSLPPTAATSLLHWKPVKGAAMSAAVQCCAGGQEVVPWQAQVASSWPLCYDIPDIAWPQ